MAKLYGFSTRKYQHHIMFAQSRLANMAYDAEDAGNQAQADYYWKKRAELCIVPLSSLVIPLSCTFLMRLGAIL